MQRGTPTPRMELLSTCVPVSWRVALLGRLGGDVDIGLDMVDLGATECIFFTRCPVGGHSIDMVESGLITKSFREFVVPGFFLVCLRDINRLTLRLSRTTMWGILLPIAVLRGS